MISMTQWNNSFGRRKVIAMLSRRGSYFYLFIIFYIYQNIKLSQTQLDYNKNKNTKK